MSFRQVSMQFPGCSVVGFLYDSDDVLELGEDMVEVRVPGGITINAGWYPEGDAEGKYRIKTWGEVELPESFACTVDEAVQIIRELVDILTNQGPQPISDSDTTIERTRDYEFA